MPNCKNHPDRPVTARGLCSACYQRLIRKGSTKKTQYNITFEQAEAMQDLRNLGFSITEVAVILNVGTTSVFAHSSGEVAALARAESIREVLEKHGLSEERKAA